MTARFGGGGHEPQEVGIDKPVEGGEGGNGGNGGGTTESVSIEDAFGNKFMEVVDLIKPEDITEKCWKGYKKKGMKTMFGKRYPNCVKANDVNEAPYQVIGSPDGKKEKKIGKPVKSKKYAAARAAELADTHKATGGKYRSEYTEEANVDEKYQGMYQSPAPTHNRLKSSDEKARMSPGRRAMAKSDELERTQPGSKRAKAQKKASMQMARNFKSARDTKEEVNVDEAVRLQAEYGNLLAVVVMWRGRSLMIKMFFPQASMPKREDVQREIEKGLSWW